MLRYSLDVFVKKTIIVLFSKLGLIIGHCICVWVRYADTYDWCAGLRLKRFGFKPGHHIVFCSFGVEFKSLYSPSTLIHLRV